MPNYKHIVLLTIATGAKALQQNENSRGSLIEIIKYSNVGLLGGLTIAVLN